MRKPARQHHIDRGRRPVLTLSYGPRNGITHRGDINNPDLEFLFSRKEDYELIEF